MNQVPLTSIVPSSIAPPITPARMRLQIVLTGYGVIIAIGLYEAWKLNRKPPLVLSGPHAIAPPEAAPVAVPQ